jgi:hypothetical protein
MQAQMQAQMQMQQSMQMQLQMQASHPPRQCACLFVCAR